MANLLSPWHLRSFHLRASSSRTAGRADDGEGDGRRPQRNSFLSPGANIPNRSAECQSATYIFAPGGDPHERTGIVDGQQVVFELREDVTKRPTTDRKERIEGVSLKCINVKRSSWDLQARWWLMKFGGVPAITALYFATFVAMNFVFAGFWFIQDGKCCDDPTMDYVQVFDYSVQTSTTIGYGGYVPIGPVSNFLVVMISLLSTILTTVYGGLLFFKFSAPSANVDFSDVMTLSNVNGLPCLELRVGNLDGSKNRLIDVRARMSYTYSIEYTDEKGEERRFGQTDDLLLLCHKHHELADVVWTIRHVVDEHSPLFGLDLLEHPGNKIYVFRVGLDAIQEITGAGISAQTGYEVQDVMIGHRFVDQMEYDKDTRKGVCDYAKFNETVPHPVWYPSSRSEQP